MELVSHKAFVVFPHGNQKFSAIVTEIKRRSDYLSSAWIDLIR